MRIETLCAEQGRHFRLSLPAGRSLFDAIVGALAGTGVHSASMSLFDGELAALSFCVAGPDHTGRVVATYSAPQSIRSARFIFGNATLGKARDGTPVVHCHAVFLTAEGEVRGGHLLTDRTVIGAVPVRVLATALDGFDLRLSDDDETRMPLLRPAPRTRHV